MWASGSQPLGPKPWSGVAGGLARHPSLSEACLWATVWARVLFKIFNHRYGTGTNQPEQNAGRSTESKRRLAVPGESRCIEETSRESQKARPIGTVRGLEAEAIHQYTWKHFNTLSACALSLYILAWYLASAPSSARSPASPPNKVRG